MKSSTDRIYLNAGLGEYEGRLAMGHSPNHPNRCKGRCRRNGQRCRNFALSGYTLCRYHGGINQQRQIRKPRLNTLAKRYKILAGALASYVEQCIDEPPHEQLALWEEISLTKHVADQAVQLYQSALQSKNAEMISLTGALMKDALKDVGDLCKRAAEIQQVTKDNISVHHIGFIVSQITRILAKRLGDNPVVDLIIGDIQKDVKIPGQVDGTTLTPSADVTVMDATIPTQESEE